MGNGSGAAKRPLHSKEKCKIQNEEINVTVQASRYSHEEHEEYEGTKQKDYK